MPKFQCYCPDDTNPSILTYEETDRYDAAERFAEWYFEVTEQCNGRFHVNVKDEEGVVMHMEVHVDWSPNFYAMDRVV
jgi:hypothetical protein